FVTYRHWPSTKPTIESGPAAVPVQEDGQELRQSDASPADGPTENRPQELPMTEAPLIAAEFTEGRVLIPATPPMKFVQSLGDLSFWSPQEGFDRNQLRSFSVEGDWRADASGVTAIGQRTALRIGIATDFQIESKV